MSIFTDSFNGASPDLTWTNTRGGGALAVAGGTAAISGSDWQFLRAAGDTGSAAMFAETVVASGLAGQARRAVVLAGYTTASATTGYAAIVNGATQVLTILRYSSNGGSPITGDVAFTVPSGSFTLRLEVDGGALAASVDGVVIASGTDANPLGGQYGGLGQRDGSAIRYDSFRTGTLADEDVPPDPDPEPGGGALAVLAAYSDTGASGGAHDLSVTAPAVSAEQGLLAVVTSIYNGDDLTPSGGDANPWQKIGGQLGANDGEANQRVAAYVLPTSGAEADRTVTVSTTNESSLTVLHLDGPPTVEDVADHTVPRASSPAAQQTVGPVEVPEAGGLLVGVWAGVQFSGSLVWEPDEAGLTVQQRPDMGGVTGALIATEYVTTGTASRTASATGDPVPDAGYAGKLLVLSGPAEVPDLPGPVATYAAELASAPGTATTEAFTPEPGEILVVKAIAGHSTIGVGAATAPGLAFQEWAASNVINYTVARLSASLVPPEGVGEIAVSVAYTGSGTVSPTVVVERWQGRALALSPAMNTTRTGAPPTPVLATVEAQGSGSVITWIASDWLAVSGGDAVYESGAVENYRRRDSAVNVWSAWQDVADPGPASIGMSEPAGQKWTMLGIELLDADALAGPEPGRFLLAVT